MLMRLRLLAAVLWTLVIMVLCWTPDVLLPVPEGPESYLFQVVHIDKFVHAGLFAIFAVLWLRALPGGMARYLWVGLGGAALAALTEVVQNVPIIHREGEFADAVADFVGVLLGVPLFLWLERVLGWGKRFVPARPAEERAKLPDQVI
jgi:hypothetical protein